jgi:GTPase SAR1 family protein
MSIFDLSGDNIYETVRKEYYKDSQGVLLCFNLADKDTFQNLDKWEKEMHANGINPKNAFIGLVGSKSD